MKDNNCADIYADIYYNNDIRFIFYADTDVRLDKPSKNISLELKSAKVGNMKIPVNVATELSPFIVAVPSTLFPLI